jgi:glutathione synthase/RimK-type ligase-like ATP-grasp enzyme
MTRIALATAIAATGRDDDELPLLEAFARQGALAEVRAWDDPTVSWSRYAAVLLRSTWDYTDRHAEFLAWCGRVSAQDLLLNPLEVVRWSSDKHYLAELEVAGVAIIPAHFIEPGENAAALPELTEFVVKPAIGAGARDTQRYRGEQREAAIQHVQRLLQAGRSVLVQPYIEGVDSLGETGMIFIEGRYSHAIRKGPLLRADGSASHDLFASETIGPRIASDAEHALAAQALAALPFGQPLYARVDMLPTPAGPRLLELELVEPSLFFATAPDAADQLAEATLRRVLRQRS